MSCIRSQILSDEQQSTEIVLIKKISHSNFGVQTFQDDSSVSYTFCSTHNFRMKSEVSAFIFFKLRLPGVQPIESSAIFGISFKVSCSEAARFESKLTLNPSGSVQQFRERRRICSFLSKNDFRLSGMRSSVRRIHSQLFLQRTSKKVISF